MPRASWRGFLRLSLVSCPIYLSPAATRTKPIRLHQVWQPAPVDVDEDDLPDPMWTRTTCRIGAEGGRVLRHRYRRSSPTMPELMETRALSPPGSRSGRMIPEPARRSRSARLSKDTNTAAVNSSPLPPRS